MKENKKNMVFFIEDKCVNGTLILESDNTTVYKLDKFESDIPFEGTSTTDIEKEFPDKKFSVEEILDTYIMFKDGKVVLGYNYE